RREERWPRNTGEGRQLKEGAAATTARNEIAWSGATGLRAGDRRGASKGRGGVSWARMSAQKAAED
ncbi:MAG: hypothetical protein ACJAVK_002496, partial [Akkermansiaceae bacterium]